MSTINLLVFDENDQFRVPLEQHLLTVPDIRLVGVETDISKALEQENDEIPDIVLYASALIKSHGTEPLQALRARFPRALIYRLTVFDDSGLDDYDYVKGFDGSVPRSQIEEHLNTIIKTFRCGSDSAET